MIKKCLMIKSRLLVPLVFLCILSLQGCAASQHEYRAYTVNNSDWKLLEDCGYESCYPLVDFLTGKDIAIRAVLTKINISGYFVMISITVYNGHRQEIINSSDHLYEIKPSDISIEIDNKKIAYKVASKPIFYNSNPSRVLIGPELLDTYRIDKMNNYSFVFEYPITQNEDIVMKFNDAFKLNGKKMEVPTIYFKKNQDKPKKAGTYR